MAVTIKKCKVYGKNYNADGSADTQSFRVELMCDIAIYKEKVIIRNHDQFKVQPDTEGEWEIELIENENMVCSDDGEPKYRFFFNANKSLDRTVPDKNQVFFGDLE